MEEYYVKVLRYLMDATDNVNQATIDIEGISIDLIKTIVSELGDRDLIGRGVGGWVWITQSGKGYLAKYELGIKESTPTVHIGHNITGQNTFNQSFNESLINSPINTPKQKTTKYPAIKWILGTISAIVAGLIVWYLAKPK